MRMLVMGAAVISISVVSLLLIALLVFFLVELYFSLLLKSRLPIHNHHSSVSPSQQQQQQQQQQQPQNPSTTLLSNKLYSQGVLLPPPTTRSMLLTAQHDMKQRQHHHHFIGLLSKPKSTPYPSLSHIATPMEIPQRDGEEAAAAATTKESEVEKEGVFVCISNPIYDDDDGDVISNENKDTPFETPETSPSRLELGFSSSSSSSSSSSPPLTPIEKLPPTVTCVAVMDKSLAPSISTDSNASTSSDSRCTSPSW